VICLLRNVASETETVFSGEKHMGSASANKLQGGDPLNDPKVATLLKRKAGLAHLLEDLQSGENPLSVPDRPHPIPPKMVIPETERVIQETILTEAAAIDTAATGIVSSQPGLQQAHVNTSTHLAEVASIETQQAPSTPVTLNQPIVSSSEPDETQVLVQDLQQQTNQTLDQTATGQMSRSIVEPEPRGRGRPLKARAHKSETSFSLDPELIRELRKESARRQWESGLTVSTSEVVEELLVAGLEQLRNKSTLAN
jgi:hypothetical protein